MDLAAAKMIGAGLAMIGVAGAGIGLGMLFSSFVNGVSRNPSAAPHVRVMTMVGFAVIEAMGLFALIIALVLLFVM
ncbi:MAG: F0F1 ATP synthase subunit C [Alphaproteobacteria bacterium]|jgi:F0F1-type ATP synthase membrane subunit c/vacuolar-type H+-ATPase subunit K|nr:F0F1 ATP synthase subunit C [Alphaproteobacteria bacterium]MDP3532135.1 F0F1 ATP synthase subunit C [Alphaproteobacteria bacterium]